LGQAQQPRGVATKNKGFISRRESDKPDLFEFKRRMEPRTRARQWSRVSLPKGFCREPPHANQAMLSRKAVPVSKRAFTQTKMLKFAPSSLLNKGCFLEAFSIYYGAVIEKISQVENEIRMRAEVY
jgi:hypothetical protein